MYAGENCYQSKAHEVYYSYLLLYQLNYVLPKDPRASTIEENFFQNYHHCGRKVNIYRTYSTIFSKLLCFFWSTPPPPSYQDSPMQIRCGISGFDPLLMTLV